LAQEALTLLFEAGVSGGVGFHLVVLLLQSTGQKQ